MKMYKKIFKVMALLLYSIGLFAQAPVVVSHDPPTEDNSGLLRPIVRIEFDQTVDVATATSGILTVKDSKGNLVDGEQQAPVNVNGKSAIHFLFSEDLTPGETYTVTLEDGIEPEDGGDANEGYTFDFEAKPRKRTIVSNNQLHFNVNTTLNGFNYANWANPAGSNSSGQTNQITTSGTGNG